MKRLFFTLVAIPLIFISTVSAQNCPNLGEPKVLIVGDSWSHIMHKERLISKQLNRIGYGDWNEKGDVTAISGSTASMWADPNALNIIKSELTNNASIEVVVLVIGGNDLLAGKTKQGWFVGMTHQEETAVMNRIETDIKTIINGMKQANPNIAILICGYDYINLVHSIFDPGTWLLWDNLGQPTPRQINDAIILLEQRKINISNQDSQVYYVHNLGLMHRKFGHEGFFGPNVTPIPGNNPPNYSPFPGGNRDFPTSKKALGGDGSDPIHLNNAGYAEITKNLINYFFIPFIKGGVNATYTSQGQSIDGFMKPGSKDNSQLRIGRDGSGFYRNVISFNTAALPDNAIVEGATIFLTRSCATLTSFPKPFDRLELKLDVKSGFFGNALVLDPEDYNAPADALDVGCFFGAVGSNESKLRIDVDLSALEFINKSGVTQFRFYMEDNVSGSIYYSFYDGDEKQESRRPTLELSYSVIGSRSIQTAEFPMRNMLEESDLVLYPNPIKEGETMYISYKEKADATVTDLFGKVITARRIAEGQNAINLPSALPIGVYYLNVNGRAGQQSTPFILAR